MKTKKTCLVQLILLLVFLGVLTAVVRRVLIGDSDQDAQAKPSLNSVAAIFRRQPKERKADGALAADLPEMPLETGGHIAGLTLGTSRPLMFAVGHPRGLTLDDRFFYLSAHDPETQSGVIYQVRRDLYAIAQMRTYSVDGRHQIGGLDLGKEKLWTALASEGEGTSSVILGIDPILLEIRVQFEAPDRIAAVVEGESGNLYGSNADGSALYEWSQTGVMAKRVPTTHGAVYGDMARVRGSLVCAGRLEGGIGTLDVIDPGTLSLLTRHSAETHSASHVAPTAGGLAFRDGSFYLLPEGGEHPKILVYALDGSETLDQYIPSVAP